MTNYVLYGGKGGVGKTTCAAATGVALADQGLETLVASADPAHSLADSLETAVGSEPTPVSGVGGLHAVEADPDEGRETYRAVVEALAEEFRAAGVRLDEADVERLFDAGVVPGSDEIATFGLLDQQGFDRVVLDTAPTGHALRMLTLPDVLEASLTTVGKLHGQLRRLVDSARSMLLGPVAFRGGDDEAIEAVRERMERVGAALRDPDRTSFRVVVTPERLPAAETKRLVERLDDLGVPVEGIVVNRVIETPDGGVEAETCPRCRARLVRQRDALSGLRDDHPDRTLRLVGEQETEPSGVAALRDLAGELSVDR